jgi:deoxycytidylate deaminase
LAKNLAVTSEYGNFRHGAVLEKGSAILGVGVNNEKYCSVGARYRSPHKGHSTYHAEIHAILNLSRDVTRGATIYVARASKKDGSYRMSKPCPMCHAVLQERGIKKVVYSVDETTIGFYKF